VHALQQDQLHVDGISIYELDPKTGLFNQHRVEHLLVNDAPIQAPHGIFSLIKEEEVRQGPEPVFYESITSTVWKVSFIRWI